MDVMELKSSSEEEDDSYLNSVAKLKGRCTNIFIVVNDYLYKVHVSIQLSNN